MSTAAVIALGVLVWLLLAVLLALFVGRMIQLRDRRRPDGIEPTAPAGRDSARAGSPQLGVRWGPTGVAPDE
jgi:uncharacterized membrane protein YdfJ with MMPL/SSD domain